MSTPQRPTYTPEQLLSLLTDLLRSGPEFSYNSPITEKELRWLGRAEAVLDACGSLIQQVSFRAARSSLTTINHSRPNLFQPLYDALSHLELQVPSSMQGAFIPPGDTWNGYSALIKLVQRDCDELLIVDPYLNADIYLHFAPHAVARNGLKCLAVEQSQSHAGLISAKSKWEADPISLTRSVQVRYAPKKALHDRLIIIDAKEVWLISQSIKDIAKRSPASVSRADNDMAHAKAQHYIDLWTQSTPIS